MKKIEFLYFENCPSYIATLENLKTVLEEENIDVDLELVNVDSPEKAFEVGFFGSPSIRIDGVDLEGRNNKPSFSCRIYSIDDIITGIPTKRFIREQLFFKII